MAVVIKTPKNEAEFRRMVANKERAIMEDGGLKVPTRGKNARKKTKRKK
jgi:hypothetical protein